jgi:O-antigen ligase
MNLPFWFWFLFVFRNALSFIFFRREPVYGTAISTLSVVIFPALFHFPTTRPKVRMHTISWPILGYLVWTGMSLFWTEAESKFSAFGYWLSFVATVFVVRSIMERAGDLSQAIFNGLKGFIAGSAALCFCALFAGTTAEFRLGDQELLHPNMLGNFFALSVIFSLFLLKNGPRKLWLWSVIAFGAALLATISKASILSLAVVLLFTGLVSFRDKLRSFAICASLALVFAGTYSKYYQYYSDSGQLETVAGRTGIWSDTVNYALDQPIIGHGVYSYRTFAPIQDTGEWDFQAWHAHNEFLQQWFAYGLVGVILSMLIYWKFFRTCLAYWHHAIGSLGFALLLYFILHGLTDANHIELSFPLALMLFLWPDCSKEPSYPHTIGPGARVGNSAIGAVPAGAVFGSP